MDKKIIQKHITIANAEIAAVYIFDAIFFCWLWLNCAVNYLFFVVTYEIYYNSSLSLSLSLFFTGTVNVSLLWCEITLMLIFCAKETSYCIDWTLLLKFTIFLYSIFTWDYVLKFRIVHIFKIFVISIIFFFFFFFFFFLTLIFIMFVCISSLENKVHAF